MEQQEQSKGVSKNIFAMNPSEYGAYIFEVSALAKQAKRGSTPRLNFPNSPKRRSR